MNGGEDSDKEEDGKIRSVEFNTEMQAGGQTQANVRETSEQVESKPSVYPSAISEQNDWPGLDPAFLHEKTKLDPDIGFSLVFQELCRLLEIRKTRTSIRNPKCNGQVERFNRTLLNMVKLYLKGEQDNWVQVGKDQEKAQSEIDSHSKNRGGKNQTNNQALIQ